MSAIKKLFAFMLLAAMLFSATTGIRSLNALAEIRVNPSDAPSEEIVLLPHQNNSVPTSKVNPDDALNTKSGNAAKTAESESIMPVPSSAEDVALAFLREATEVRYCGEERNFERFSFIGLPDNVNAELTAQLIFDESNDTDKEQMNNPASRISKRPLPEAEISAAVRKYDRGELDYCRRNLEQYRKCILYYGHSNKLYVDGYEYFTPSYEVFDVEENGDTATVRVCEDLDFRYKGVDFLSSIGRDFKIDLVKHRDNWVIMAVWSNDELSALPEDFDLAAGIAGLDAAYAQQYASSPQFEEEVVDEQPINKSESRFVSLEKGTEWDPYPYEQCVPSLPPLPSYNESTDRVYSKDNAVNYALTYTKSEKGNGNQSGPSPWKNTRFYYEDKDCIRFVSQCIWAGLGGSNDQASINNMRGMDSIGSDKHHKWYGTGAKNNESFSWISTNGFKNYTINIRNAPSSESGIVCAIKLIAENQPNLTIGTGPDTIISGDLKGAALFVKGMDVYRHAIILTQVLGATRNKAYFTAYNARHRNVILTDTAPADGNRYNRIYVAVPKFMRQGNPGNANYLYGTLKNALTKNTEQTVYAGARWSVPTLTLKVYKPNATTPVCTVTRHNASTINSPVLFNTLGEWRVEVLAAGADAFTYTVRVATAGDLENG